MTSPTIRSSCCGVLAMLVLASGCGSDEPVGFSAVGGTAPGGAGGTSSGGSAGGPSANGGAAVGGTTTAGGSTPLGGGTAQAGAATGGTSSGGGTAAEFSTWTYHEKPMGLYLPSQATRPLPVVLYLHACHNDPVYPGHWLIAQANAIEPCAVFLPTAQPVDGNCADWGGTYDQALRPNLVDALAELDRLIAQHGFDVRRQYVHGESMGGEAVFRLLAEFPSRFAAAVSAAGYTLDTGASAMAATPLWIFHGSADTINSVTSVRAISQSIRAAGGTELKYTEYPDLDHVPAIERARGEPGLFEWLFGHRR